MTATGDLCRAVGSHEHHEPDGDNASIPHPPQPPGDTVTVTDDMRIRWEADDARRDLTAAHAAAEAAAERVTFQLTYDRTEPREFSRCEMDGPMAPNAYGDGEQSLLWFDGDDPDEPTVDAWIDKYARLAVNEAVHEALEWFKVDGRQWLDPHGEHEGAVFEAVNALCARLAELRRPTTTESGRTTT